MKSPEDRAHAYALGDVGAVIRPAIRRFRELRLRTDDSEMGAAVLELERLIQERIASAFLIGHGAGIVDREKPTWRR